jgi:hypothetical protein
MRKSSILYSIIRMVFLSMKSQKENFKSHIFVYLTAFQ